MSNEKAIVVSMSAAVGFALIAFAIVYEVFQTLVGPLGMAFLLALGLFVGGVAVYAGTIIYEVFYEVKHDQTPK